MIKDGFTDMSNQIVGSGEGSCARGCGNYYQYLNRRGGCAGAPRRYEPQYNPSGQYQTAPQTQVGAIAIPSNPALQQIVDICTSAIQDLPADLRDYILRVIYAPNVVPDAIMRLAYVLRQCPEDSGLKQRCMFVAGCLQQMGYSRMDLNQWTRISMGY